MGQVRQDAERNLEVRQEKVQFQINPERTEQASDLNGLSQTMRASSQIQKRLIHGQERGTWAQCCCPSSVDIILWVSLYGL